MRTVVALVLLLLTATRASAQVSDTNVAVPMRDGAVLRATVLRPDAVGRYPTLVYRTPYGATEAITDYTIFARAVRQGYVVVVQDVRGRYRSGGDFLPYQQEGADGYDTIEWAAAQPWSDGNVGTFGLSYPGAVQWLAAVESPPHLRAMVPAMTFSRPTNFWYAGGLPDLSWPAWIWYNIAPDLRQRRGLPGPTTAAAIDSTWRAVRESLTRRLPITDVPELATIAPWYVEWLRHPPDDPWWSWADLTTKYPRVHAAVLNVSGWHDDNYGPEGALTNQLGLLTARAGADDPAAYLILGPWVHGVAGMSNRTAQAHAGERVFGAVAGIDYDGEILRFMDRYLKGDTAALRQVPRFRVFAMGENRWHESNRWPLPGTRDSALFLSEQRGKAGRLDWTRARRGGRRTIFADPGNPVVDPYAEESGAHNYGNLGEQPGTTIFETDQLDRDLLVVGQIRAELFIDTDAPDLDLWVKLLDVMPDGTAWNVMSAGLDVQRLSYASGGQRSQPAPGPRRVVLDNLITGNRFSRGHRLRIVVMTSFMPAFSRNLQTGALETESAVMQPAHLTILSGPEHPSRLVLPVLPDR